MCSALSAILPLLVLPGLPRPEPPSLRAEYVFLIDDPGEGLVDVHLRLEHLDGPCELSLPERIAFASPPEPRLAGEVEATSGSLTRSAPFRWHLDPEGDTAELHWSVPLDHRELPFAKRSAYEMPYLRGDHGFLVTATLAIAPVGIDPASIRVRFELPGGWETVAPWPSIDGDTFAPGDWNSLQNDLVAVGRWDVTRMQPGDVDLAVAFAPSVARRKDAILERIEPVIETEIDLFGRIPNAHYAFFFSDPDMNGLGGSVKANSMTLLVDESYPDSYVAEQIGHLIAHEYHHTWMFSLDVHPKEQEVHFVTEGFTDYFAYLVPWWSGLGEDGALLAAFEGKLADYEESQADKERSLWDAGGAPFYEDPSAYTAVYAGGLALALLTELAIQRHGEDGSVEALLREFYDGPTDRPGEPRGFEDWLELVERYAGESFAASVREWVHVDGPFDLVAAFAQLGVDVTREEGPCDLSSLRANLEGTTLGGIDSSDPARAVGVRTGDRLRVVNGVEVATEADVRRAWGAPREGRVRVQGERDGQPFEIDVPVPRDVRYHLPREVLEVLHRR